MDYRSRKIAERLEARKEQLQAELDNIEYELELLYGESEEED